MNNRPRDSKFPFKGFGKKSELHCNLGRGRRCVCGWNVSYFSRSIRSILAKCGIGLFALWGGLLILSTNWCGPFCCFYIFFRWFSVVAFYVTLYLLILKCVICNIIMRHVFKYSTDQGAPYCAVASKISCIPVPA